MKSKNINPYDCVQVAKIRKRHRAKQIEQRKEVQKRKRDLGLGLGF